jgi:DNA polymerase III subunit gamma/tau
VPDEPHQQQASLYRRHRPRTFDDVVGQEPVVRTLRNAVERDRVHHAYLFVGSRGTGKTSMAKILAACLNCERGPTVTPCGECDSCTAIARANSLDVIEMDAASNNSVDDIRELRDSVAFAPVSGRRKVYILDEAHMLSTAAWNAFLKTLEEPPPDTVFVLATTEAGKVPATVVDRCHRFDFQRPAVEQIAQVLRRTAERESIAIGPEAVAALARAATGSFRDALGTLEQLLAYSGPEIALPDVLAVLGIADAGLLERTVDAIAAADARGALLALAECADGGRDAGSFASDLESRARDLLVVQALGEVPLELALTPEADERLLAQARRVSHATVVRLLELIGSALESVRAGADARTSLELALVKAARPETDASTKALLARIERLEGGGAVAQVPATSDGAPTVPATPPAAPSPRAAPTSQPPAALVAPAPSAQPESSAQPSSSAPPSPAAEPAPSAADPASSVPAPTPPAPAPNSASAASPMSPAPAPSPASAASPTPPAPAPVPATAVVPQAPTVAADLQSLVELWPAVVELVEAGNEMIGAVIASARPVEVAGEDLTVGFPVSDSFFKKKAEAPANRQMVTDALRQLAGGRWRVSYELREDLDGAGEQSAARTYTEEEWIERFKTELDAEEIPLEPAAGGDDAASMGEPAPTHGEPEPAAAGSRREEA